MHAAELLLGMGMAHIEHVQEHVGVHRFFERGAEAGDEVMRQIADEADGVGQEQLAAAVDLPGAGFGVERGEQLVVGIGAGGGEGVEERALAGVGVADEAGGGVLAGTLGDEAGFAVLDLADFPGEIGDAFANDSAVGFELGFAGAAGADAHALTAAGDALEGDPTCGPAADRCIASGPARLAAWPRGSEPGWRRCRGSIRSGRGL